MGKSYRIYKKNSNGRYEVLSHIERDTLWNIVGLRWDSEFDCGIIFCSHTDAVNRKAEIAEYYGRPISDIKIFEVGSIPATLEETEDGINVTCECDKNTMLLSDIKELIFDAKDSINKSLGFEDEEDVVNHPAHYENDKYQCIEVMEDIYGTEAVMNFCICNAFKYIWRFQKKNGIEDIRKAQWYINKYLELVETITMEVAE